MVVVIVKKSRELAQWGKIEQLLVEHLVEELGNS